MNKVLILIGGNEGERFQNIEEAITLIKEKVGIIKLKSSIVESEPWGFEHQQDFLNQVIEVETALNLQQLLSACQEIEKTLGRRPKKSTGYEGRTMDIDILFFNDCTIDTENLIVPHPRLHERRFTLLPLVEKWPNYIHPILNKSMLELLNECNDNGRVNFI